MLRVAVQTAKPTKKFVRHFAQPKTNAGWNEAKSNMINGDLQASSGVSQGRDKINNVPFLGPESKQGRDRNRENMADSEEFPRNDVGSGYPRDGKLSGGQHSNQNQQLHNQRGQAPKLENDRRGSNQKWKYTKKSDAQIGKEQYYNKEVSVTPGSQFKDDERFASFNKESHFENGLSAEEIASIRQTAANGKGEEIDFYGMKQVEDEFNARVAKENAERELQQSNAQYSSKWGSDIDRDSKWKKELDDASNYSDSTVNSQSDSYTNAILGTVKNTFKNISESVSSTVLPAAETLGNVVAKTLDGKGLNNVVNTATEKAKGGMEVLKSGVTGAADVVKESVAYAAEAIPPMANNLKNKAEEIVGASSAQLKEKAENAYEMAKDTVSSSLSGAKKELEKGVNSVKKEAYGGAKADAKDMEMEDTSVSKQGKKF